MARRYRIGTIAGARPNFMKIAPVVAALKRRPDAFDSLLVHTGQHYDEQMSQVFFDELGIPRPDINLNVGSGSHAQQTAAIMTGFEQVLLAQSIDMVLVVGDVNSTIACSLIAYPYTSCSCPSAPSRNHDAVCSKVAISPSPRSTSGRSRSRKARPSRP